MFDNVLKRLDNGSVISLHGEPFYGLTIYKSDDTKERQESLDESHVNGSLDVSEFLREQPRDMDAEKDRKILDDLAASVEEMSAFGGKR